VPAGELVVVVVVVSEVAGLDVVVVVVESVLVLGLAAGATVSVFCSHAASNAAPAKTQMSLFIIVDLRSQYRVNAKLGQASFSRLPIYVD
jgi:hypothetical protein